MKKHNILPSLLFILSFFFAFHAHAQSYWLTGVVISVADGDTFTMQTQDKKKHKIRMDQIDAPEISMPFSFAAKQELHRIIYKKNVRVFVHDKDQYNRLVSTVYLGDANVNLYMVRKGLAWVYRKYAREVVFFMAEQQAQEERLGIWSSKKRPTEPWVFRQNREANNHKIPKKQKTIEN